MENKQTKMLGNKKGILGLEDAKAVILFLMVLGVLAIALFLPLDTIIRGTSQLNTRTVPIASFANNTINLNSSNAATPGDLQTVMANNPNDRNFVLSSVIITNFTGGEILASANYTVSEATIIGTSAIRTYNNTNVNVSANYVYDVNGYAVDLQNNITSGSTNFFRNIPTVFILLGAVVIVAVIVLIIVAASRISGGNFGQ